METTKEMMNRVTEDFIKGEEIKGQIIRAELNEDEGDYTEYDHGEGRIGED